MSAEPIQRTFDIQPPRGQSEGQPEISSETSPEQAGLEGETSKADKAEEMEEHLQAAEAANHQLEGRVGDETVALGVDMASGNPADVVSDTQQFIEQLPGIDSKEAKELADLADALATEVKSYGPEDAGMNAKVEAFCREKLGTSLAKALRGAAELMVPGLDLTLAGRVLSGEASARDGVRFVAKVIAPPLGGLIYDGFFADDKQTRELLESSAVKGKLGATFLRALQVVPGAAVLTRPAAVIMERIADRQRALAERPGKISNLDIARAILGGIVPDDKDEAKQMVQAIVGVAGDSERMAALGLDDDAQRMVGLIVEQAESNPDRIVDALHRFIGYQETLKPAA